MAFRGAMALFFFHSATGAMALSGCDTCTANNHAIITGKQTGKLRAWCFASKSCIDLGISLLSSCSDFTFDNTQCGCAHYSSCAACASTSHLDCVWVANATVKWKLDLKLPIAPLLQANKSFVLKEARCMPGSAFSLRQTSALRFDHALAKLNFTSVTTPDAFYWGTCKFTAMAMLDLLGGVVVLVSVLCCACCCWSSRRKARARRIRLIEHTQVGSPGGISIQQVAEDIK